MCLTLHININNIKYYSILFNIIYCNCHVKDVTYYTWNFIRETYFLILFNIKEIAKCNVVCKFRYNFDFFNTETFYSQLYNEIHMSNVICISKTFQGVSCECNFFQCRLILEKPSCIISYLNWDIIDVLFKYSNTPFLKIESHVLSYLEIKYSLHHSLIEAVNLLR